MPDNTNHALNAQSIATAVLNAYKTVVDSRTQEAIRKADAPRVGRMVQTREEVRRRDLEQRTNRPWIPTRTDLRK